MCGILTPDSGICKINGLIPYKDRKKYVKDIGVVFGNRSALWWDVPVEDSFELIKEIYGISDETYKRQKNMLVEMLNIKEIIKNYKLDAKILNSERIKYLQYHRKIFDAKNN